MGIGTFLLGTSEFMIIGLLPELATHLSVDIAGASLLVSVFALGMVVGAPVMSIVTLTLDQRRSLLIACMVFAVAHGLVLIVDGFVPLLLLRLLGALACATYWSIGAVIAVREAPVGRSAEALSLMIGGITLAAVLGVPLGTWIGQTYGWKASFGLLAVLTVLAAVLLSLVLPRRERERDVDLKALVKREIKAFRRGTLWLALATTILSQAGIFAGFTYFIPMLTDAGAVVAGEAPVVLLAFGVGSIVGVYIGGRLADRFPAGVLLGGLALLAAGLGAVLVAAEVPGAVFPAAFAFGTFAFCLGGVLNARVFTLAGGAPTLAASANVSAFNVGNTIGPWVGGLVLAYGGVWSAPLWVAIALVSIALITALTSLRAEHRANADRIGSGI
ncbi:DHA1 family chloramphenicol resistance protein-like MFS transporter [Saccharothrix ecbatanensis]|uniref:DHA1 family chloramphenicol resistance protein-like MFS transporter n=1 Tax=Saccharothrix ecbatanensis TaxID=1105145 RepID=A0A7W9HIX3_9PSEU|nr:MFS transporter [Saccharothrix ecbatanensis]MBB5802970.1 DHA1 family chloramphenicol resistance protein-like MFS transporter [Saccharothrix ecbatanensis]